ncbi:hypothetical protein FFLO_04090 [Filobasidium floriforme]|uniref:Uncharacterized protein n=1 Tax=Filobasidium floriforme TaxID=5210 RepID=A0A8K0JPT8_9TREE|nr:uncharacterized protein HD553DRAFT_341377 [Filobasidium floriforme]KAG7531785.1 hypothetical protein FFLO_04090 [Filobasidium floriforme]KAH8086533.1 hypothetical protein HD553DRAFT_341377 [Filobasidium floriforme]
MSKPTAGYPSGFDRTAAAGMGMLPDSGTMSKRKRLKRDRPYGLTDPDWPDLSLLFSFVNIGRRDQVSIKSYQDRSVEASSAQSAAKMTTPASNLANSQPDLVLPVEIMIQIFQDYAAFRCTEPLIGIPLDPFGDYKTKAIRRDWLVMPTLLTCKLFNALMLPEVYRTVYVIGGLLLNLLKQAKTESLDLIQTLRFSYPITGRSSLDLVSEVVEDRILQSQLVHFHEYPGRCRPCPPHASYPEQAANYRSWWKKQKRPRTESVNTDCKSLAILAVISRFFTIEHILIDGYNANDSVYDFDFIMPGPKLTFNIRCSNRSTVDESRWRIDTLIEESSGAIVLKLGWETRSPKSVAYLTLCDLLPRFFFGRGTITISPFIPGEDRKVNQHAWCFPRRTPCIDVPSICQSYQLRLPYPEIRFESGCNCGNGDSTGFWNDCEAKVSEWVKSLFKNAELEHSTWPPSSP